MAGTSLKTDKFCISEIFSIANIVRIQNEIIDLYVYTL